MKKLNKLLSVFVITGAVSASLGALSACGHTHTFSEDWTPDGANGHYHAAECDDYDGEKNSFEGHTDANSEGKCDKCGYVLTPGSSTVAVTGVSLSGAETVVAGQTITLTATVAPNNATNKAVTWTTSNASVATVSGGVVTGVAEGTATITVTTADGSKTATKTITVTAAQQKPPVAEIPEDAEGLAISGVTLEHVLSTEKTSANIDLSNMVVKYADANGTALEGEALAADKYTVTVAKADAPTVPLTKYDEIKDDASFLILVELKADDEIFGQATVVVKNPVVTLEVKTGTGVLFEQMQSPTDSMTSTWTYEGTRANGDKVNVAKADVTVTGLDTLTVGENKTANLAFGTATGTVKYTITVNNEKVTQQFALNFSALTEEQENAIKAQAENSHSPLVLQDGRFEVCSTKSGSVDNVGSADRDFEGKYFAKRLKMNGASASSKCPRYIKVKVDGPATLTVYAYNNGSDTRKVALFGGMTVTTEAPITATFNNQVGTSEEIASKTNKKFTYNLTAAGDYYIACEVNGVCFTYVQLDQQMPAADNQEILLGTGSVNVAEIKVEKTDAQDNAHMVFGTEFDVADAKENYMVKAIGVSNVTCNKVETDVTAEATFTAHDDFATAFGERTINVAYGDFTTSYKVIVDSQVPGIYGATIDFIANLDTAVQEGTQFNLKWNHIAVAPLGENANATFNYTVSYNDTTIGSDDENGIDFAISDTPYTITVVATASLTDGTNATVTRELSLNVVKKAGEGEQQAITIDMAEATLGIENNTKTGITTYEKGKGVFKLGSEVQGKSKNATYGSGDSAKSFTKAVQISSSNTLTVKVTGACTIKVYAATSGSDGVARSLTATGTGVTSASTNTGSTASGTAKVYEFTVTAAGEIVFNPDNSSMNVFMIEIVPAAAE